MNDALFTILPGLTIDRAYTLWNRNGDGIAVVRVLNKSFEKALRACTHNEFEEMARAVHVDTEAGFAVIVTHDGGAVYVLGRITTLKPSSLALTRIGWVNAKTEFQTTPPDTQ